jgi:hypothetical protein
MSDHEFSVGLSAFILVMFALSAAAVAGARR